MKELGSRERYMLSRIANPIRPVIRVGKSGLTEGIISAIDEILEKKELIKIKFVDFKDEKGSIAARISDTTGSTLVRVIGNIAIFYRAARNPKNRRITERGEYIK